MVPPKTTEGTTFSNLAATPLSNWPNSLLLLMNIEFTLITLPRIFAGVFNCRMVPLITMLIPSRNPLNINTANESQNIFDKAKTMIQTPNPPTAYNNFFPCCLCNGKSVSNTTTKIEPISDAAFSQPNPMAPDLRISFAKTGIMATAPPNNTANRLKKQSEALLLHSLMFFSRPVHSKPVWVSIGIKKQSLIKPIVK